MVASAASLKRALAEKALSASTLAGVELRSQLRDRTPKDTGKTSRGWFVTPPVLSGNRITFHVRHPHDGSSPALSPRPEWLSQGTKPHIILPRRAKVLVFPGRNSGGVQAPTRTGAALVFARMVRHPGTKGTGFIEDTLSPGNVGEVFLRAFALTP